MKLTPRNSVSLPQGFAVYRQSDFALEYHHSPSVAEVVSQTLDRVNLITGVAEAKDFLVIADTLVMSFSHVDLALFRIEAYTNWAQWDHCLIEIPETSGAARICLAEQPSESRLSLHATPEVYYSRIQRRLRIKLGLPQPTTCYFQTSETLVVGVSSEEISELFLDQIDIR